MSRTRHNTKNLRRTQDKIEYLRDKKQEECFAEMAEDADDGEGHAGEVAEGVAWEDSGREPPHPQTSNTSETHDEG